MIQVGITPMSYNIQDWKKWRRWMRSCKRKTDELIEMVNRGHEPVIDDKLYKRRSIKKMFFLNSLGPFRQKCAYCETYIHDGMDSDIDHFRPKLGVTDEFDDPIMIVDGDGVEINHPGYYWLAYDWRNLLPTCKRCNSASETGNNRNGKRNRFPTMNYHATLPGHEVRERPLIIHPINDNPEEYLNVDIETGLIIPKHTSDDEFWLLSIPSPDGGSDGDCKNFSDFPLRAIKTIETLCLNRDELPEERQEAIDHVRILLDKVSNKDTDEIKRQDAATELCIIMNGEKHFTLATRCYIKDYYLKHAELRNYLNNEDK